MSNQPSAITAVHKPVGTGALRAPFLHSPPRRVGIPLSLTSCGEDTTNKRILLIRACWRNVDRVSLLYFTGDTGNGKESALKQKGPVDQLQLSLVD